MVLCLGVCSITTDAQSKIKLQEGDLLFQNLDCGPLCDAIEKVTTGYKGLAFSHIGFVVNEKDSLYVLEAIGKDVHLTPVHIFFQRSHHAVYIGRVKSKYSSLLKDAVAFAKHQTGVLYDDVFLYNNGKYYCSELIYDAFKYANEGLPFFSLEPMTFCEPATSVFFPAWVDYYNELNIKIPEGEAGINPGGISTSRKISILGTVQ